MASSSCPQTSSAPRPREGYCTINTELSQDASMDVTDVESILKADLMFD